MSRYTLRLHELIEQGYTLPLHDYPIFDESYREELNNKIIDYFYMREIGYETPTLFIKKFYLKMHLIMPKLNIIKNSIDEVKSYLNTNTQIDESVTTRDNVDTLNRSVEENSSSDNSNKNLFSDTPSSNIAGDIDTQEYATNLTLDEQKNTLGSIGSENTTNTKKDNEINKYTSYGINQNASVILNDLKNNLFSWDMLVLEELENMFISLYD